MTPASIARFLTFCRRLFVLCLKYIIGSVGAMIAQIEAIGLIALIGLILFIGSVSPISPIGELETMSARIPFATYRLQFNHLFTLKQAAAILDYLRDLGVSDCYASPLFMARRGSLHGYDVIDP